MIANLKKNKKKGFTLVELIVVIAIIAIIAAVAVPTTISYVNKAKISTADQEATELMNTLNTSMTDLALDAPVGGVTAEVFGKLLTSVMPEVKNIDYVVVNVDSVTGTDPHTTVKIAVVTTVTADEDDTKKDGKYSDPDLNRKVGAVKEFNWTNMGIQAGADLDGTYKLTNNNWAKSTT